MKAVEPRQTKVARVRDTETAGYRKGEAVRRRILDIALREFGVQGFAGATTRRIAELAEVTLPALQYYFGGKEGLYRACAEEVVERYRSRTSEPSREALLSLTGGGTAEEARAHLKRVLRAVAEVLLKSGDAQTWAWFIAREINDPGPGFEILFARLWSPGIRLTAALVARVLDQPLDSPRAKVHALLLISSLVTFHRGREVALRTLEWDEVANDEYALIIAVIDEHVDSLGASQTPPR